MSFSILYYYLVWTFCISYLFSSPCLSLFIHDRCSFAYTKLFQRQCNQSYFATHFWMELLLVNLISFTEATKHGTLLWHQQKYVNLSLWIITSRFFILQKKVSGASEWCMVYSCKCDLTRSGTMTDLQCIPEKQRQLVRNALSTQM